MITPPSLLRAAGVLGVCLFQSLAAATIYQENFDGDATTHLDGTAPDTRPGTEVWAASTAATAIRTDGSIAGTGGTSAWLPFSVQSGYVYTMTAVADNIVWQTGSVTPVGIGFTTNTPLSPAAVNLVGSGDYGILQVRRGGSWAFFEGDTNNATATASSANNTLFSSGTQNNYAITLVLDTSASNWTLAGYFDGAQVDLNGASAGLLFTYSANPAITGVGINYGSSSFVFDSFTLDGVAVVPEPSSFAFLAGLGALGLTVVARRAKRS